MLGGYRGSPLSRVYASAVWLCQEGSACARAGRTGGKRAEEIRWENRVASIPACGTHGRGRGLRGNETNAPSSPFRIRPRALAWPRCFAFCPRASGIDVYPRMPLFLRAEREACSSAQPAAATCTDRYSRCFLNRVPFLFHTLSSSSFVCSRFSGS